MADEAASPAGFDADALNAHVRSSVIGAIQEMRNETNQQAAQQNQQRQQAQQWAADPVAQTIAPYIAPMAQQMNLRVQAAEDKSDFYLGHQEAQEYKGEIESMFNQLMTQGRPMEREAVWYYFKGRNEQMFAEKARAAQETQLANAARTGVSVGGSDMNRPGGGMDLANFGSLPLEKKREALGNAQF